ncbi:MAG: PKD domain-containing protein [Ancrocorticia sp.]
MNSLRRRITAGLAAVATALTGGLVLTPAASAAPEDPIPAMSDADTVSADALPAPQMNGVVWQQEIVGSTVYAVGNFTKARPAGSAAGVNEVDRTHILAYNIDTGELLPFAPTFNGQIYDVELSPDGKTFYVGGAFTEINGQSRYRAAAFDAATGALKGWRPIVNYNVTTLLATDSTVYMGGLFATVNNETRTRIVGVDTRTGTTNTSFNPTIPDGEVRGVQLSPDGTKLILSGSFTSVNGSNWPGFGLARLDVATSESLSFPVNGVVRNAGPKSAVYSLNSDASGIYGTGYDFGGPSPFEGGFHTDWNGNIIWLDGCKGDSYDIWPTPNSKIVYQASHKHNCAPLGNFPQTNPWTYHHASANTNYATGVNRSGDFPGRPSPSMYAFRPEFTPGTITGANQAVWTVTGNDKYVLYAGEFPRVNNTAQQGIVRFARRDVSPNKQGPVFGSAAGAPTLTAVPHTGLRVSIPGNYDRDDYQLRYTVYRNDSNTIIYDGVRDSRWYDRAGFSIIDTGATPGETVRYKVRVTDPKGNAAHSSWVETVAPEAAPLGPIATKVIADEPLHYWRLTEPDGTAAYDWAGSADLALRNADRGREGLNDQLATRFRGSSSSSASTSTLEIGRDTFSIEVWFNTTQRGGGKIIGFGNRQTGNSNSNDRHLYLDNQNRLSFGVYPGAQRIVQTSGAMNDGQWHHAVGTLDETGMRLYVDGQLVGERTDTTSGQAYNGYWRVGGDSTWSGNQYFNGVVSDAAVYAKSLTAEQVARHFNAGIPQPPVANFDVSTHGLDVSFDGSTTTVIDGQIVDYAWDFGDGTTGTGVKPSHTYTAVGTYNVTLTVTDDRGATATVSKSVEVAELPNDAPVALFDIDTKGLEIDVDASDSSDADGSIASYAWDFGDGTTATGATASHEYAAAGSYNVTLTVTDDRGATGTVTRTIEVAEIPNAAPVAEFGVETTGLEIDVDASASSDADGSIASYAWDFGDGTTATGATASHEYAAAGTYEVTLTVTDDRGATGTVKKNVVVAEIPNVAPVAEFSSSANELAVSFDGSASSDADGSIASYAWEFGDGTTATGAKPSHTYTAAGSYNVKLTVTDNRGATGTVTKTVTVAETPVIVPEANFTTTATGLQVAFDGSSSSVQGGSIASYAWEFGDGKTATGAKPSHTYTAAGSYNVKLTVTDNRGVTASVTKAVVVTEAVNAAPVAEFSSSVDGLDVAFDGSASSDADGSIASYAWNFGDGKTGTGAKPSHKYAAAGTYNVTLTVTDNRGATGTASRSVTVTEATQPADALARDMFNRTVANGWGSAQIGGAWTVGAGTANRYSVAAGVAKQTIHGAGHTTRMNLAEVSSSNTDFRFQVGLDKVPTANLLVKGVVRRAGSAEYAGQVTFQPSGGVALHILRNGTPVRGGNVSGLTVAAGEKLNVAVQAEGSAPTTLRVKVWKVGSAEPASWNYTLSDSTAALQVPGSLSLVSYLGGAATNAPIEVGFSNVWAGPVGTTPGGETPNEAPVASFSSSVDGLKVAFDGSASSDADGSIASYAWNFGDGKTGTGAKPSHTYTESGTYEVTLTVTDNRGTQGSATRSVTVSEGTEPVLVLANDAFNRTVSSGWGSAQVGGPWTVGVDAASHYSVANGVAKQRIPGAGRTLRTNLEAVSSSNTDFRFQVGLDKVPTANLLVKGVVRRAGSAEYAGQVTFQPSGGVALHILRNGTPVRGGNVSGLTVAAGEKLNVAVQAEGSAPTTLRVKVWKVGSAEPASWNYTLSDSTAALQVPGSLSLVSYLGGAATNAPIEVGFSNVWAGPVGTTP